MTGRNDITSLTDFHSHLRDHLDQSKATGRPLFVTSEGEAQAVVLSPAAYDALLEQAELAKSLATLDRGMTEVQAGKSRPAKAAIRTVAAKLELTLDR